MVLTRHKNLFEKMVMLRNHGIDKDGKERFGSDAGWSYDMKILGRNYRITDFQCALGISQLKKIDVFIKRRSAIVKRYNDAFSGLGVQTPRFYPYSRSAWHIYTVLLPKGIDRDDFYARMRSKNIGVNVHYIPCYKHSYYKTYGCFSEKDFPVTEEVFSRILTLPLHPWLSDEEVDYIISSFIR